MTTWRTLSVSDENKKRLEKVEIDGAEQGYNAKLGMLLDVYERLEQTGFLEILKSL